MQHIRGLKLLADLCLAGGVTQEKAIEIAERIQRDNPLHITAKIIDDFIYSIKRK